jgi:hypothetical protein
MLDRSADFDDAFALDEDLAGLEHAASLNVE